MLAPFHVTHVKLEDVVSQAAKRLVQAAADLALETRGPQRAIGRMAPAIALGGPFGSLGPNDRVSRAQVRDHR